jgi:hypothetical protein
MKKIVQLLAAASIALICQAPAMAAEGRPVPLPDLVGTWTGSFKLLRWTGGGEATLELRVLEQDGELFRAEKSWEIAPGGTPGSVGGKLVTKATEPLVGVIGFDGTSVTMAEQGDGGVYTGRLAHPDTLEMIYFEPGDVATVNRITLNRTK